MLSLKTVVRELSTTWTNVLESIRAFQFQVIWQVFNAGHVVRKQLHILESLAKDVVG